MVCIYFKVDISHKIQDTHAELHRTKEDKQKKIFESNLEEGIKQLYEADGGRELGERRDEE